MTSPATISPGQIRAIHALIGRLGWDDDMYRAMLKARHGVQTCKALSYVRAALLIDELKAKVSPSTGSGRTEISPARPVQARRAHTWTRQAEDRRLKAGGGTISPKQQALIDALFTRLGWDQRRRDGFCLKTIGCYWAQTNAQVSALLKILRPIAARYGTAGYDRREKNA